jgi:hypothetical protein
VSNEMERWSRIATKEAVVDCLNVGQLCWYLPAKPVKNHEDSDRKAGIAPGIITGYLPNTR